MSMLQASRRLVGDPSLTTQIGKSQIAAARFPGYDEEAGGKTGRKCGRAMTKPMVTHRGENPHNLTG